MKNKLHLKYLIFTALSTFLILFLITRNHKGIKGKKILVTAPINYNNRLSKLIEESEAEAIIMPSIKIILNYNNPSLDTIFNNLSQYKYICLPSRNAIRVFFTKAKRLNINHNTLSQPIYSAIGKDVEFLRTFNVEKILECKTASPQGIINTLKLKKDITNKKIAVLTPEVIGLSEPNVIPNLLKDLKDIGLRVKRINAYTTKINDDTDFSKEINDIKSGNIDLIAFTSSAEIEALLSIIGGRKELKNTKISCFGPYTSFHAKKWGLEPCFVSKDYSSFERYIESMNTYFIKD